jgi:hypothetical protein
VAFGTPNYSVVGSILIGSIPGILIGSHFTNRAPERVLRGTIALVLAASGLKTLDAPIVAYVIGAGVILAVAGVYAAKGHRFGSELKPEPQAR